MVGYLFDHNFTETRQERGRPKEVSRKQITAGGKMTGDLSKDWLTYVLIIGMIWFFAYVIIKGNQKPKDDKKEDALK